MTRKSFDSRTGSIANFMPFVNEHKAKLATILADCGPSSLDTIRYFLLRRYDVYMDNNTLSQFIAVIENGGQIDDQWNELKIIEKITPDGLLYHLPGDETRPARVPVSIDYAQAYIELYLRYTAIREHPELATMAEDYIDALYLDPTAEIVT